MTITTVRAETGRYAPHFRTGGYVAIGWFDAPIPESVTRESVRDLYLAAFPDHTKGRADQNAGQIYRFLTSIPEGSWVLTPSAGADIWAGRVTGPPYYEAAPADGCPYAYRLPVAWNDVPLDRHAFSIPLQNTLGSSLTVFNVPQVHEVAAALGLEASTPTSTAVPAPAAPSPGTHARVLQALHELSAEEFEILVTYLLRTLGFQAEHTGKSGDGGVDVAGTLNLYGLASVRLQVQVKRYAATRIGEKDIRHFRGALKRDHQACFLTLSDFDRKARASADDPERTRIHLLNGAQFVDLLTEQYDDIVDALNEDEHPLAAPLLAKIRFRKVLIPA